MEGISINTQTERRVDSVLASLIAALVAYGGNSPRKTSDTPIQPPEIDDLVAALQLVVPADAAAGSRRAGSRQKKRRVRFTGPWKKRAATRCGCC